MNMPAIGSMLQSNEQRRPCMTSNRLSKPSRTRWGGLAHPRRSTTGYFRTANIDGVWWLIGPAGGRFLSKGVDNVSARQDRIQNSDRIPYAETCRRKYRTVKAWRTAAAG